MDWPDLAPQIEAELESAAQWYEDQRVGLGDDFLEIILELLHRIRENPEQFPAIHGHARRAVVTRRFPFSIYFREWGGTIQVLAILHNARSPEEWLHRV